MRMNGDGSSTLCGSQSGRGAAAVVPKKMMRENQSSKLHSRLLRILLLLLMDLPRVIRSSTLLSSSWLEDCKHDATQIEDLNCRRKLIMNLSVVHGKNDESDTVETFVTSIHEVGGQVSDLAEPYRLTIYKSDVYAHYPLNFMQAFNYDPHEVVSPAPNCNYADVDSMGNCGWGCKEAYPTYLFRSQLVGTLFQRLINHCGSKVLHSQGFCCLCSFKDTLPKWMGGTKSVKRYDLDCSLKSMAGQLPLWRNGSVHCLRLSDKWYPTYEILDPSLKVSIRVVLHRLYPDTQSFYKAKNDELESLKLSLSETRQVNRQRTMKAGLVAQFDSTTSIPGLQVFNGLYLSIPNQEGKSDMNEDLNQWLALGKGNYTLDGSQCNKIGVSYKAFHSQSDPCLHEFQSCCRKQLKMYAEEEAKRQAESNEKLYSISHHGRIISNLLDPSTRQLRLEMLLNESLTSTLTLELKADDIHFYNRTTGRIVEAYAHVFKKRKCTLFVEATNLGSRTATFTVKVHNCSVGIEVMSSAKNVMLPVPADISLVSYVLRFTDETASSHFCGVTLVDSTGEIQDTRQVKFESLVQRHSNRRKVVDETTSPSPDEASGPESPPLVVNDTGCWWLSLCWVFGSGNDTSKNNQARNWTYFNWTCGNCSTSVIKDVPCFIRFYCWKPIMIVFGGTAITVITVVGIYLVWRGEGATTGKSAIEYLKEKFNKSENKEESGATKGNEQSDDNDSGSHPASSGIDVDGDDGESDDAGYGGSSKSSTTTSESPSKGLFGGLFLPNKKSKRKRAWSGYLDVSDDDDGDGGSSRSSGRSKRSKRSKSVSHGFCGGFFSKKRKRHNDKKKKGRSKSRSKGKGLFSFFKGRTKKKSRKKKGEKSKKKMNNEEDKKGKEKNKKKRIRFRELLGSEMKKKKKKKEKKKRRKETRLRKKVHKGEKEIHVENLEKTDEESRGLTKIKSSLSSLWGKLTGSEKKEDLKDLKSNDDSVKDEEKDADHSELEKKSKKKRKHTPGGTKKKEKQKKSTVMNLFEHSSVKAEKKKKGKRKKTDSKEEIEAKREERKKKKQLQDQEQHWWNMQPLRNFFEQKKDKRKYKEHSALGKQKDEKEHSVSIQKEAYLKKEKKKKKEKYTQEEIEMKREARKKKKKELQDQEQHWWNMQPLRNFFKQKKDKRKYKEHSALGKQKDEKEHSVTIQKEAYLKKEKKKKKEKYTQEEIEMKREARKKKKKELQDQEQHWWNMQPLRNFFEQKKDKRKYKEHSALGKQKDEKEHSITIQKEAYLKKEKKKKKEKYTQEEIEMKREARKKKKKELQDQEQHWWNMQPLRNFFEQEKDKQKYKERSPLGKQKDEKEHSVTIQKEAYLKKEKKKKKEKYTQEEIEMKRAARKKKKELQAQEPHLSNMQPFMNLFEHKEDMNKNEDGHSVTTLSNVFAKEVKKKIKKEKKEKDTQEAIEMKREARKKKKELQAQELHLLNMQPFMNLFEHKEDMNKNEDGHSVTTLSNVSAKEVKKKIKKEKKEKDTQEAIEMKREARKRKKEIQAQEPHWLNMQPFMNLFEQKEDMNKNEDSVTTLPNVLAKEGKKKVKEEKKEKNSQEAIEMKREARKKKKELQAQEPHWLNMQPFMNLFEQKEDMNKNEDVHSVTTLSNVSTKEVKKKIKKEKKEKDTQEAIEMKREARKKKKELQAQEPHWLNMQPFMNLFEQKEDMNKNEDSVTTLPNVLAKEGKKKVKEEKKEKNTQEAIEMKREARKKKKELQAQEPHWLNMQPFMNLFEQKEDRNKNEDVHSITTLSNVSTNEVKKKVKEEKKSKEQDSKEAIEAKREERKKKKGLQTQELHSSDMQSLDMFMDFFEQGTRKEEEHSVLTHPDTSLGKEEKKKEKKKKKEKDSEETIKAKRQERKKKKHIQAHEILPYSNMFMNLIEQEKDKKNSKEKHSVALLQDVSVTKENKTKKQKTKIEKDSEETIEAKRQERKKKKEFQAQEQHWSSMQELEDFQQVNTDSMQSPSWDVQNIQDGMQQDTFIDSFVPTQPQSLLEPLTLEPVLSPELLLKSMKEKREKKKVANITSTPAEQSNTSSTEVVVDTAAIPKERIMNKMKKVNKKGANLDDGLINSTNEQRGSSNEKMPFFLDKTSTAILLSGAQMPSKLSELTQSSKEKEEKKSAEKALKSTKEKNMKHEVSLELQSQLRSSSTYNKDDVESDTMFGSLFEEEESTSSKVLSVPTSLNPLETQQTQELLSLKRQPQEKKKKKKLYPSKQSSSSARSQPMQQHFDSYIDDLHTDTIFGDIFTEETKTSMGLTPLPSHSDASQIHMGTTPTNVRELSIPSLEPQEMKAKTTMLKNDKRIQPLSIIQSSQEIYRQPAKQVEIDPNSLKVEGTFENLVEGRETTLNSIPMLVPSSTHKLIDELSSTPMIALALDPNVVSSSQLSSSSNVTSFANDSHHTSTYFYPNKPIASSIQQLPSSFVVSTTDHLSVDSTTPTLGMKVTSPQQVLSSNVGLVVDLPSSTITTHVLDPIAMSPQQIPSSTISSSTNDLLHILSIPTNPIEHNVLSFQPLHSSLHSLVPTLVGSTNEDLSLTATSNIDPNASSSQQLPSSNAYPFFAGNFTQMRSPLDPITASLQQHPSFCNTSPSSKFVDKLSPTLTINATLHPLSQHQSSPSSIFPTNTPVVNFLVNSTLPNPNFASLQQRSSSLVDIPVGILHPIVYSTIAHSSTDLSTSILPTSSYSSIIGISTQPSTSLISPYPIASRIVPYQIEKQPPFQQSFSSSKNLSSMNSIIYAQKMSQLDPSQSYKSLPLSTPYGLHSQGDCFQTLSSTSFPLSSVKSSPQAFSQPLKAYAPLVIQSDLHPQDATISTPSFSQQLYESSKLSTSVPLLFSKKSLIPQVINSTSSLLKLIPSSSMSSSKKSQFAHSEPLSSQPLSQSQLLLQKGQLSQSQSHAHAHATLQSISSQSAQTSSSQSCSSSTLPPSSSQNISSVRSKQHFSHISQPHFSQKVHSIQSQPHRLSTYPQLSQNVKFFHSQPTRPQTDLQNVQSFHSQPRPPSSLPQPPLKNVHSLHSQSRPPSSSPQPPLQNVQSLHSQPRPPSTSPQPPLQNVHSLHFQPHSPSLASQPPLQNVQSLSSQPHRPFTPPQPPLQNVQSFRPQSHPSLIHPPPQNVQSFRSQPHPQNVQSFHPQPRPSFTVLPLKNNHSFRSQPQSQPPSSRTSQNVQSLHSQSRPLSTPSPLQNDPSFHPQSHPPPSPQNNQSSQSQLHFVPQPSQSGSHIQPPPLLLLPGPSNRQQSTPSWPREANYDQIITLTTSHNLVYFNIERLQLDRFAKHSDLNEQSISVIGTLDFAPNKMFIFKLSKPYEYRVKENKYGVRKRTMESVGNLPCFDQLLTVDEAKQFISTVPRYTCINKL